MAYKSAPPKSTGMKRFLTAEGDQLMLVEVEDIGDFKIISDQPTRAPINTWDDKPIFWTRIRTLTLEGGLVVYGCGECDYVAKSAMSVRPHLNRHKQRPAKSPDSPLVDSLMEVVHRADSADRRVEKMKSERDEWKRRALKAEGDLEMLKRVFGK